MFISMRLLMGSKQASLDVIRIVPYHPSLYILITHAAQE